ncbi:hypothetical protein [Microbulbifer sp. HZ11]|uniref:hypothetical protein n=1 Tax=Microbulbifer sp. HZ11 TaxID=1453501 RepID=UPI0005BD3CE2|nr:hypothetical protein [Microbulbifer sp. HZ11]
MAAKNYNDSVFINCPFDDDYINHFHAKIFCIFDCGFIARCAQEVEDAGEVRIEKISKIISQCKYGIHDISRTELCKKTSLPRFNMPLELGIFLGAKKYGNSDQKRKLCMVLDKEPWRYQIFLSDIAGQDIRSHNGDPEESIKVVSAWLRNANPKRKISGGTEIVRRYREFREELPELCKAAKIKPKEMTFNDYTQFVAAWLEQDRAKAA